MEFKLKDILAVVGFPKATYMYWQKRFNRDNPNKKLEIQSLKSVKNIRIMAIVGYWVN